MGDQASISQNMQPASLGTGSSSFEVVADSACRLSMVPLQAVFLDRRTNVGDKVGYQASCKVPNSHHDSTLLCIGSISMSVSMMSTMGLPRSVHATPGPV